MASADAERLPWLDPPSAAPRAAARTTAGRRAARPLLLVLALFLFTGVGMIAYLAGRGSVRAPVAEAPRSPAAPKATLPAAVAPPPAPEGRPPVPVVAVERLAPIAGRAAVATKPTMARAAPQRRSHRAAKFRPSRRVLAARRALVQPQRVVHASKMVQLGTYRNRRYADAAYRRLVRVYPYLATLPKTVIATRSPRGDARSYRLRLKAYSPDHARILCQNLLSIGRGCTVLPVTA